MLPHIAKDVDITVHTSTDGLNLEAVATLNDLAWGGQSNEKAIRKKVEKLRKRISQLPPDRQGMIIGRSAGTIVGYCRVVQDERDATCWVLRELVVHPDWRRRAVGKTVVIWAISYAKARGATIMRSQTHADNLASVAFHEAMGFQNEGPFVGEDGDRLVGFSLDLDHFMPSPCANTYDVDAHVAEIYDQFETQTDDVALLHSLMGQGRSLRILEPFCGCGRILIPLAADGHTLVGLDQAQTMLDKAAVKLGAMPAEVGRRVKLVRADVLADPWPAGFDLVVLGGNCFYELGCPREQEHCIASALQALKAGGHVYVDNDHMEGTLHPSWQKLGKRITRFPTGICADGTRVEGTTETVWFDTATRLWLARRGVTVTRTDGRANCIEMVQYKHPVSKDEVAGWLDRHGFVIEQTFGDRVGNPYTPESPRAIFWARKEENSL
jgi:L-amino acid N-acyltransferase YncA